jgi:alpha-mannosidase
MALLMDSGGILIQYQISVKNNRDKVYSNASLLVYGNGDGGGGPLASMIERLRRMKNVVK